jgi:hypothetical protein
VPDQMIDIIFQPRALHLEFFDFLVSGEIDVFFDAINGVIQTMILVEHFAEMIVRALEAFDDVPVFRELAVDRMM